MTNNTLKKRAALFPVMLAGLVSTVAFVGCAQTAADAQLERPTRLQVSSAVAVLNPTAGNEVRGVVHFVPAAGGVTIDARVEGLSPGAHGFHIHEHGDCNAPDGSSAGGHWNPGSEHHGGPDSETRHAGDLGNIIAGSDGVGRLVRSDRHLSLEGMDSIVGRGVIIHESEDDLVSQPTGAAGARLACGVISISRP